MKNIFILGTCRTGKTTFSKILQKELDNYQILEVDSIISALQSTFDNIEIGFIHDNLKNNKLSEFLSILIEKFQTRLGCEYNFIINSDSILPEDLIKYFDFSSIIVYYFVNSKLTVDQMFENCRNYDNKNQWTFKRTDEQLRKHLRIAKEFEIEIINQCKKYNIECIDTSYKRDTLFKNLVNDIKNKLD